MTYLDLEAGPLAYTVVLAIGYWLYRWNQNRKARGGLPLPPGPKGLPLIGNLYDIPPTFEWERYARWSEQYDSDIIYLNVAGTSIVILNTPKAATDLFDKRSAIYSSRPNSSMLKLLVYALILHIAFSSHPMHYSIQANRFFGHLKYGEPWREHRKMFQQHFHPLDTESHQPKEQEWMHKLLKKLYDSPEKFAQHIRHVVGAITIEIAYGLKVKPSNDPYIESADKAVRAISTAAAPGAFLVDSLPLLRYVPGWFPGAGFKCKALEWRESLRVMVEVPFYDAERAIAAGTAPPTSFVANCLNSLDETKDMEEQKRVVMSTAGNFFLGGADTSVNALTTFVLLMTLHPDIQAKAQAELDRVLGKHVLPTFADEPSLPYIGAILMHDACPYRSSPLHPIYDQSGKLAVPHFIEQNDVYNGFFIPKNTIVAGNVWAIHHNERDYPEPHVFRPERFLTPDGSHLDPNVPEPLASFGFGRRICPGRHMALSMMYMGIASILSVFDISKVLDKDGNPITPSGEFTSSLISRPVPFECAITPRSIEAERCLTLSIGTTRYPGEGVAIQSDHPNRRAYRKKMEKFHDTSPAGVGVLDPWQEEEWAKKEREIRNERARRGMKQRDLLNWEMEQREEWHQEMEPETQRRENEWRPRTTRRHEVHGRRVADMHPARSRIHPTKLGKTSLTKLSGRQPDLANRKTLFDSVTDAICVQFGKDVDLGSWTCATSIYFQSGKRRWYRSDVTSSSREGAQVDLVKGNTRM
ncbi:hypothetical protein NMY22_g7251 [Coprinellus aureogranulatus]|nr:hypothetical protein NMY22_g7251 [Coprinellus aureogranulatus]